MTNGNELQFIAISFFFFRNTINESLRLKLNLKRNTVLTDIRRFKKRVLTDIHRFKELLLMFDGLKKREF